MIKVCHVSTAHKASDVRIFHKECVTLAANGYDVTLIANGEPETKSGVRIISFPNLSRAKRLLLGRYIALKLALDVDADIYHLHDPDLLLIAKKLKRKGKKVIFDSHEDYYQQIQNKSYIPRVIRQPLARGFRIYQKHISQNLDGFVFPAENNNFDLKVEVIVVGNSPILIRQEEIKRIPFIERDRAICYIGGLSYSRGITHLIKVAHKANCKLVLAGPFVSKEYQEECQRMEEYSVVDYRGVLTQEEVFKLLPGVRIGMATLLNVGQYKNSENFATKVTEYCMFELPVIMNETPFHKKMVDIHNFGFCVNPEDIEEQANLITNIIDDASMLEEMGKHGRSLVETHYNWDNESINLLSLYSNMASGKKY